MEEQQGREFTNSPQMLTVDCPVAGSLSEKTLTDEERDMISQPSLTRWYTAENLVEEERNKREKEMVVSVLSTALDLAKAACSRDEQNEPPEKVCF